MVENWHVFAVLLAWIGAAALHLDIDGMGYSDASRHVANGIFWRDYLRDFTFDAQGYALSYYARYPVIKPTAYPPVFYLIEAALFSIIPPSAYAAKCLVLTFALVAALYTSAWIKRWVHPRYAWFGAALLFLPQMVSLSHTVMLQVPALAFTLGALYHARRWLEESSPRTTRRQFALTIVFSILATFTYFIAGLVVLIILAWLLVEQRGVHLKKRSVLIALAGGCVGGLLTLLMAMIWAPMHLSWLMPSPTTLLSPSRWGHYPRIVPNQFMWPLLITSGLGLAALITARHRAAATALWLWIAVLYLSLSWIDAKSARYILPAAPAVICLTPLGLLAISSLLPEAAQRFAERFLIQAILAILVYVQLTGLQSHHVHDVQGIDHVVDYMRDVAPDEMVFYDGPNDGAFALKMLCDDPNFQRGVVNGQKLLYAYAVNAHTRLEQYVQTTDDVVDLLRTQSGCRWYVVEYSDDRPSEIEAAQLLLEALGGREFSWVKTFEVKGKMGPAWVDVYRARFDVDPITTRSIPFPILGEGVRHRAKPIPTRVPNDETP